jgi:hypothetical protein
MVAALVCVLVIVPIMSTSCHDNSFTTTPPAPFFSVQKEPDPSNIYPEALAEGKLVLDNSYLRLKPSWGKGELLIWRYGYSLRIEGKEFRSLIMTASLWRVWEIK